MASGKIRQREFRSRRLAQGITQHQVWATAAEWELIKSMGVESLARNEQVHLRQISHAQVLLDNLARWCDR